MENRVSVGDFLEGMSVEPLAADARPVFAFVLVKYEDEAGSGWGFRTTSKPNREELLGALMVQTELVKAGLIDDWDVDDEDGLG